MMAAVLLLILWVTASQVVAKETLCRDHEGNPVDWWVLLTMPYSSDFFYLSSKDAARGEKYTLPLNSKAEITDPQTSPLLRTLYDSRPEHNVESASDNRLVMAWNDQQPEDNLVTFMPKKDKKASKQGGGGRGKATSDVAKSQPATPSEPTSQPSRAKQRAASGEADEEEAAAAGKGRDFLGNPEHLGFAHSKGFVGMEVRATGDGGSQNKGQVSMYIITHSFPRIPIGEPVKVTEEEFTKFIPIRRRFIVEDPRKLFGSNITGPRSKAQHAFCMSAKQQVDLRNGEIVFDRKTLNLNSGKQPLFAILDVLDTIGVSITLTNYVPWLKHFRVYHQLFDIRGKWSDIPFGVDDWVKTSNVARIPKPGGSRNLSFTTHAYPLWPNRTMTTPTKFAMQAKLGKKLLSLRSIESVNATRCQAWGERTRDPGCLSSGLIMTTSADGEPLAVQLLGKNRLVPVDTDGLIASRLFSKKDLERVMAGNGKAASTEAPPKRSQFIVAQQSWYGSSTLKSQEMHLVDNANYYVKVDFFNVVEAVFPFQTEKFGVKSFKVMSKAQNHAKWFVLYPYGPDEATLYRPLAGFGDLNRSGKATQLDNESYGRGGAFFISEDIPFVRFFMALAPKVERNSGFREVPLEDLIKNYQDAPGIPAKGRAPLKVFCKEDSIKLMSKDGEDCEGFCMPVITTGDSETLISLDNLNLDELGTAPQSSDSQSHTSGRHTHFTRSPPLRTLSVDYDPSPRKVSAVVDVKSTHNVPPSGAKLERKISATVPEIKGKSGAGPVKKEPAPDSSLPKASTVEATRRAPSSGANPKTNVATTVPEIKSRSGAGPVKGEKASESNLPKAPTVSPPPRADPKKELQSPQPRTKTTLAAVTRDSHPPPKIQDEGDARQGGDKSRTPKATTRNLVKTPGPGTATTHTPHEDPKSKVLDDKETRSQRGRSSQGSLKDVKKEAKAPNIKATETPRASKSEAQSPPKVLSSQRPFGNTAGGQPTGGLRSKSSGALGATLKKVDPSRTPSKGNVSGTVQRPPSAHRAPTASSKPPAEFKDDRRVPTVQGTPKTQHRDNVK